MAKKTVILSVIFMGVFFTVSLFAETWHIETVDSTGRYTSIALDVNGNPHISYQDWTNYYLKYATFNGLTWEIETVDTEVKGYSSSIALDSNDHPHISYDEDTNRDLKYAAFNGRTWDIETVDSTGRVGLEASIALDVEDYPHISYRDATNSDLKYAVFNGSTWDIQTVDSSGQVGMSSSIAIDASGNPHISYYHYSFGDLKYAAFNGKTWHIETVDSTISVGSQSSMALDANGHPHISYHDRTNRDLKYATFNGSIWEIETVDYGEGYWGTGHDTSIALDAGDHPHISYWDMHNGDLKYAAFNGSTWDIQTIDSTGDVGRDTSIALDADDNPHISYQDWSNKDLKYAYAGPEIEVVTLDIKPTSCPNPLNTKSKGVLPVAILGSEDVNVLEIIPTSIELGGVGALRNAYEDVASPASDTNDCNCTTDGPDGFLDLTLKFKAQDIVEAMCEANDGDILPLLLTGELFDGTPIEGVDCVLIKGKHFKKADFNKDGAIDFLDYVFFSAYYGLTDCNDFNDCDSTDLDFSGIVDANDLDIFTSYWMSCK
ncbi:MAG: hypothetical protein ACYTEE_10695 [Planctomycetota bacterium]|jgi:hypothetical protein